MLISYNKHFRGKPAAKKDSNGKPLLNKRGEIVLFYNDVPVNLGYGWENIDVELSELFELLTVDGIAIAPALLSDRRATDTFKSHQLALVDIDSGMRIEDLENDDFYKEFSSGYYTTPSHTEEAHRFRIIYALPEAVESAETMRSIYQGLLAVYNGADVSCKDPSRLFYGTINAKRKLFREGKGLSSIAMQCLIDLSDKNQKSKEIALANTVKHRECARAVVTVEEVQKLLNELKKHYPELPYDIRRNVTWAVQSMMSNADTVQLMRERWPDSALNGKYEMFCNDFKRPALSLGSVVHMIRQFNPLFHKSEKSIRSMTTEELQLALNNKNNKKEKQ